LAEILRLALVGGLVGLDTTAAFQIMISQPLIGGLLAGWALGDPWVGAFVGLLFQGLYLAEIPVGGRIFPDGNLAAVQAAALTVYGQSHLGLGLGTSLLVGFLWSIPVAMICGQAIIWTRKLHAVYLPLFDRFVNADRRGAINALFGWIVVENFLISAIVTVVLFYVGLALVRLYMSFGLPLGFTHVWGSALRGALLGAGCAVIYSVLIGAMKRYRLWLSAATVVLSALVWAVGF
jgi:mannose/fructose/N-acetylgalactosamine-specific phosphotransferase system component IIC